MAYRVSFSPIEAFATVTLSEVVTWNDVAAALCALLGHPGWLPSYAILWDTTAVTALDVSPSDVPGARGLMEALAAARDGGRSAVVVAPATEARLNVRALTAALVGLGPSTRREVRAFERQAEALLFLGRRRIPAGLPVVAASTPPPPSPHRPGPLPGSSHPRLSAPPPHAGGARSGPR